ncbi:MAG: sel1 repeat family protein [Eubacterium sp.]|nr:sel1 repeat family protein [Eubacterium sp.]
MLSKERVIKIATLPKWMRDVNNSQIKPRLFLLWEDCKEKQRANILKYIAPGCPPEKIVIVADTSDGKGKRGLAFTQEEMYASKEMLRTAGFFSKPISSPIKYADVRALKTVGIDYSGYLLVEHRDKRKTEIYAGCYTEYFYELRKNFYWEMLNVEEEEKKKRIEEIHQKSAGIIAIGDELAASGNYSEAFKYYSKAAEQGDFYGMYHVGLAFEKGEGIKQDLKAAYNWYRKAAKADICPEACVKLGEMLIAGTGPEQDRYLGKSFYDAAARAGYADGNYRYGMELYKETQQGGSCESLALRYLEKAAAQGHKEAIVKFREYDEKQKRELKEALHYLSMKDYSEAAERLEILANRGIFRAQYLYGQLNWQGQGVPKNSERAFGYFKRAANGDDPDALYMCGSLYLMGEGVEEDRGKANEMLQRAKKLGNVYAANLLENSRIFDGNTIFHMKG